MARKRSAAIGKLCCTVLLLDKCYLPCFAHLTCRSQPADSATAEAEQVADRASDQKEIEALKKQAFTSFTGLPNKAAFEKAIGVLLTRSQDCLVCVIAIDLVGFKYCNTAMGHGGGDVALKDFASQFKAHCQRHECLASWRECAAYHNGGDEFAMICSPPDLPALRGFVEELAKIEYIGTGTEPGCVGELVHSWVRAGAVVRPVQHM
jgi:GGDEF domain-containing protein